MQKERESADDDEMGIEDVLALNPPAIGRHDWYVWNWYHRNVNKQLILDYNLLPMLLERMRLPEGSFEVFLAKLDMIHLMKQNIARRKLEKEGQDV